MKPRLISAGDSGEADYRSRLAMNAPAQMPGHLSPNDGSASASPRRTHRWDITYQDHLKTERSCRYCPIVRVTRHPPVGFAFVEFFNGLDKIETDRTPECPRDLDRKDPAET